MTRLFREGRTETVRSCTTESCCFCPCHDQQQNGTMPTGEGESICTSVVVLETRKDWTGIPNPRPYFID